MKNFLSVESPIGTLTIAEDGIGITDICMSSETPGTKIQSKSTQLLCGAAKQLSEYFSGKRETFTLPLSLHGTEFQLAVWKALHNIPYGETKSYKQIAEQLGRPKAFRAVGMANRCNPILIAVPCHRVIGSGGSLTGYRAGLEAKRFLLALEQKYK
jgi:methylated-DNA-[protein]-cysteine S-methyltransferase